MIGAWIAASLVLVIYHADAHVADGSDLLGSPDEHTQASTWASTTAGGGALADVCNAAGGSFFDGVVRFREDGNVTFDAATDRCPAAANMQSES